MPLIIHSKSTKEYAKTIAKEYNSVKLIDVSTIKIPKSQNDPVVVGIGGGKVIDYAKVMAGNTRSIAIPTTMTGASATSHAVVWNRETKRKIDIPTEKPILRIELSFLESLPKKILKETAYDALGHVLDSYWSKKATKESTRLSKRAYSMIMSQIKDNFDNPVEWIEAGHIAGCAMEITGTNMIHALSYPLTLIYNIPHRLAVEWAIPFCVKYQECDLYVPDLKAELNNVGMNIKIIAKEAMKHQKIHNAKKDITEKELIKLLSG